mgnify:CR=1 FL=1
MSDDEKSIDNKTIIKIIISIVITLGAHFSNFGERKNVVHITLVICAILTILHFYQETCSDYQCPDGYVKDESKKDTECESFTCDSVDRDTCCISKQKCSEYTCPTGYEGKDNADNIYCKGSVCKESDDKDTCCNKSVNCEGRWLDFSECSVECGGGTQTRTYSITIEAQNGGASCPTSHGSQDSQACNTDACATCSSYGCPNNYSLRAEAADVSCGKTQCDDSNIDICCEINQDGIGGGDPDGDPDGVDVVANATCSTVSGNCPVGYLYNTGSAGIDCNGPTCDVGIGGDDLNTCCLKFNCTDPFTQGNPPVGYVADENVGSVTFSGGSVAGVRCDTENGYYLPYFNIITATCGDDIDGQPPNYILSGCDQGCTSPGSLPTGYTGNLPAILPVSGGDITAIHCDANYQGDPTYNCTAGNQYTLDGCDLDPDICNTPNDTTGYNITNITSLQRNNFPVNVTCEDGYGPSNQGDIPRASCSGDSVDYSLTGCENKIGFCSGNTDSSNDVDCPRGYNDKPDKNTIVGNTLETCCDEIITPEVQPSGTQSTELPICSQVAVANKLPETIITDIPVDNLKNCSDFCAQIPGCQYFSYSDIVSGENQHHQHQNNCILSGSSGMIDINSNNLNYLNYLNPSYVSWSFYQKCQVPLCDSIKLTGVNPNKNPILSYRANDVGTCENNCSGRDKNICNSFSFNKLPGNYRCYIYDEENLTTVNNQNFDYYPVKCQP